MRSEKFLPLFCELIQTEAEVTPKTPLAAIEEWDSMAQMTIIAWLDAEQGRSISFDELATLSTVGDVQKLFSTDGDE